MNSSSQVICNSDKSRRLIHLFDSLLVLLNISTYCSVIPYIVFHQYYRGWNLLFITIINFVYLRFRFKEKLKFPSDLLFIAFICVNITNILAVIMSGEINTLPYLYFFMNSAFYVLLYNLYQEYIESESTNNSIRLVARGYIWLCAIGVASAISLFLLIKMGLDPTTTATADEYYDLFWSNVNVLGHTYYFPYHISVLQEAGPISMKFPFFMEYGTICGVFHEPHVITFVVFPALFILWFFETRKYVCAFYFVLWILIILLTGSTTNVLAFLVSLMTFMLIEKKGRKWFVLVFVIIVYLFVYIGLENTEMIFILDKLDDADGSRSYSVGTIEFAFTPTTLFGSNFMSNSYLTEISTAGIRDVGYLSFFFNIIFLVIFIYRIVKTVFFSEKFRLLGIAALYFFLHSMKTAMVTYTNTLLLLVMFLLFVVNNEENLKNSNSYGKD